MPTDAELLAVAERALRGIADQCDCDLGPNGLNWEPDSHARREHLRLCPSQDAHAALAEIARLRAQAKPDVAALEDAPKVYACGCRESQPCETHGLKSEGGPACWCASAPHAPHTHGASGGVPYNEAGDCGDDE